MVRRALIARRDLLLAAIQDTLYDEPRQIDQDELNSPFAGELNSTLKSTV